VKAFVPEHEDEYTAIILTGSGTAAVEAALLSSLPLGKRAMVITNGVYGDRLSVMIKMHRLGVPDMKFEWGVTPDIKMVEKAMIQHPEVHTVAMVHHETTLGFINPVKEIAEMVDAKNRVFVLDSVSGLGGEAVDIGGSKIYLVAGASQKCIQGFPGLGFVLVRKGFMERVKTYPKRSMYLNLTNYYEEQERGTIPFTPAVQVYYAFREALNELLEEGVANRIQRFQGYASTIRSRMQELGVKAVLPPEVQGNTLTAFNLPDGVTYAQLHDGLKQEGYIIYAGQAQLEDKIFRVANIGALTNQNIDGFLSAFQVTLEKARA
jgi:2-aminoethylphosphonate-pyruvate transaminase